MNHHIVMKQVKTLTQNPFITNIIQQFLQRIEIYRGQYQQVEEHGIPKGCALSPILGALYLIEVDTYARNKRLTYVRYMDDLIFISTKRHHLKRVIRGLFTTLKKLKLTYKSAKNLGRASTHRLHLSRFFD